VDWSLLHSLNGFFARHDGVEDPILAYVNAAELLFVGMLALVILLAHGRRFASWRRAAVAGGLSAGLALAIGKALSILVDRARPFVTHPAGVHLFAPHAADASFPSDHATASFAIGTALVLRKRWWGVVVLVAATVLSVGRVAVGFHYPSDVLGGAVLGTACALALSAGPIRARIDALSDLTGGLWDRLLDRGAARVAAPFAGGGKSPPPAA